MLFSVVLIVFLWLSMFSKGPGASTSLMVIDSEIENSPVKVVKGDKFRWAVSYRLRTRQLLSTKPLPFHKKY